MNNDLIQKLGGGNRRSIGQSERVVEEILAQPERFGELFECMLHSDPLVRMRAVDAAEKITARRPDLLQPYKDRLLSQVAQVPQQEVRWHVAQMFSRLELTSEERRVVVDILYDFMHEKSKIVKTFSMQALADIADQDDALYPEILSRLEIYTSQGSPAMKSRGMKLLAKLKKHRPLD